MLPSTPYLLLRPNNVVAASSTPFGITETDFAADNTSQTTYNWSARNFAVGAANATRVVVVIINSRQAGIVAGLSSVLINGSAATLVVSGLNQATNTDTDEIYMLAVSTGTTVTVSATYPVAMIRAGCAVYSVLGSNGAVPSGAAIGTSVVANPSAAITVPAGGGTIFGGCFSGATGASVNIGTLDVNAANPGTLWTLAGHDTASSGSTTYTITPVGGPNNPVAAFAAWHP